MHGRESPRNNWGSEGYYAEVQIDANAANLAGITNARVALTTKTILSGAELTTYREGDHTIPVVLRTYREQRADLNDLSGIFVTGTSGKVPLNSIAKVVPTCIAVSGFCMRRWRKMGQTIQFSLISPLGRVASA